MKILIVGFPYVRKNFSETFDYCPDSENISFLLPRIWKVKRGKVVYRPAQKENVLTTPAYFHHSHYPIIGGLLKGFMPFFPQYARQFKKAGGTLVYACSEPNLFSTLYFNIWSRIFGLKVVNFTWENIDPRLKYKGVSGWIQIFILKLNLLLCHGIICGNRKAEEIIQSIIYKPTSHIPMNGLDPNFFRRQDVPKEINNISLNNSIVFTFIGAIGKRKGVLNIIEAFQEVLQKIPNAYLVIVGSGEYESEVKEKIEKDSIHHIIRIPWAEHSETLKILSVSDVFLYPSISYKGWEEQFGYSMAEASLMELPIIASRTGSIDEVVKDGKTGLLVEPGDTLGIAEAMIKLSENKALRANLGQAGRVFITDEYSHAVIAKKYSDFFKKIISKN